MTIKNRENMSENTKNPTALEAVKEKVTATIGQINRQIKARMEKAEGNYLYFFEWNAEEVYQLHHRRKFYTGLLKKLEEWDGVDIVLDLLRMARHKGEELIRGSLVRNSTSRMANLVHSLGLQAEQELIKEIESLAHLARHAESNYRCDD